MIMKLFKRIKKNGKKVYVVGALLLLGVSNTLAAEFTLNTNIASVTPRTLHLIDGYVAINTITVSATSIAPIRVSFYAAPGTNTYFTNGAYTNYSYTAGTYTNIYTNFVGLPTTQTWAAVTKTTNSVAANTNSYPLVWTTTVYSNAPVTITFPGAGIAASAGLSITNEKSVEVTISYTQ
jgi:hypothetical protein